MDHNNFMDRHNYIVHVRVWDRVYAMCSLSSLTRTHTHTWQIAPWQPSKSLRPHSQFVVPFRPKNAATNGNRTPQEASTIYQAINCADNCKRLHLLVACGDDTYECAWSVKKCRVRKRATTAECRRIIARQFSARWRDCARWHEWSSRLCVGVRVCLLARLGGYDTYAEGCAWFSANVRAHESGA